jgi:hypothetical protein
VLFASLTKLATVPSQPKFNLFARQNRGLLLDLVVFVANVFLMRLLTGFVVGLFKRADNNDPGAKFLLLSGAIAMWILPAAGAVLKRWHFHRRLAAEHKTLASTQTSLAGCLFNPIMYFCLNLVVMATITAGLGTMLVGQKGMDNGAIFVPSIFLGLALTIFQTYLIFRYFSAPKKPPTSGFLLSPESELLGDICFFLNMLLFQCAWNLITFTSFGRVTGIVDFLGRLFFLSFVALLIYFPPRMFYLAEDINRPRTWLTMLLANSPVICKVLIGQNHQAGW